MDGPGTDENAVWDTLNGLYADERAAVTIKYHELYNKVLQQEFGDEFSNTTIWGNELDRTLRLYWHGDLSVADWVFFAVSGWGTDDAMLQAALAEIGDMTSAELGALRTQYQSRFGETLDAAVLGDVSGRAAMRAEIALRGRPSGIIAEAQRLLAERNFEGNLDSMFNMWSDLFNDSYGNMDRGTTQLQTALSNYETNPCLGTEEPLRQTIDQLRQHLQSFVEHRDATVNVTANALATAAGIAVVIGSGCVATPLVVAVAAGAGGATQALSRMALSGHFDWEQLPADLVLGAVAGGTAALRLPAATREALANGTAQIGILRQVSGSAFVGGAASTGLATALNDQTWSEGFAAGVLNVTQSALVGGLAGTALPAMVGAGVVTARTALPFARRIVTATGTAVTNLFDGTWVRAGATAIAAGGTAFQTYLETTLTSWSTNLDAIAQRLLTVTPTESELATRTALREILNTTIWNQIQRDFVEDVAISTLRANRGQLSSFGLTGMRGALSEGTHAAMATARGSLAELESRITTNAAGVVTGGFSEAQINTVARNLAALEHPDTAAVRRILEAELGAANVNAEMVRRVRDLAPDQALAWLAPNFGTPSPSKILNNLANTLSPGQNPYNFNLATTATRIRFGTII